MLALLITGSVLPDFHISVRADEEVNTSDSQAQTDVGKEDGFIISSDFQEQTDTETEDEFTITFDSQEQTDTETEDESTMTLDSQEQTDTETEDEFTNTFDSQDQADTETEDELIMTFDSQDQTDVGAGGGLTIASDTQEQTNTGLKEGFNITSFKVEMDGQPLEAAEFVYSGAEIKISLEWTLENTVRVDNESYEPGSFPPQTLEIDINSLNLMGIELSDIEEPLYYDGQIVGKYYVEGDKIHIVIEDEYFYQHKEGRHGGLTFFGKVERDENVKNDGKPKEVGIGESVFEKDYYLSKTESSVSVNKSLEGGLDAKVVNGDTKYYQTYKVTVKAQNGTVHNIDLKDTPTTPDSLTNPTDVKIVINRVDSSEEKTFSSLDEALAAIQAINDLYMGESIDIYYTMEVNADIFNQDVQGYNNEVSGKYISNRKEEPQDTNKDSAWIDGNISGNEPAIYKQGLRYEVGDDGKSYVIWKITIRLNELYDETKPNLQDYINKIEDIPGNGFIDASEAKGIDLSLFKPTGNPGEYTYEYKLEVTDDVLNSPVDVELSNKVEAFFKDNDEPYEREGHFTFKEHTHASIEKTFAGHTREKDGMYLTWNIEVSDIPEGVAGFTITDNSMVWSNIGGNQGLLTQIRLTDSVDHTGEPVLVVDGATDSWGGDGEGIITPDGQSIIKNVSFGGAYEGKYTSSTIEFQDKYIDKIAKNNGKITIQVQTLITEDTIGKEYINGARVSYKEPNTQKGWVSDESRDNFHDTKNLLTKEGKGIAGKNAIKYTIKVLLPVLEIKESGGHFIITDTLPEELSVDIEDTDTITVQLTDIWGGNVRVQDSDMQYTPTLEGQKLIVDITATDNFVKQIQGYPDGTSDGYYLVVNVTAEVKDQEKFLNEGKTVSLENNASGTYNNAPIGEATVTNDLTPAQMVEKRGEYDQKSAPYAKYTVHVNRESITFLDGGYLTAVDQLGSALTFVNEGDHTVQVYEVNGSSDSSWDEKKLGSDEYSYEISDDKRTLNFTKLPDGKHLRIEYWAFVEFKDVKEFDEQNGSNRFALKGYTSDQAQAGFSFTGDTFTPMGWVDSEVGSITLYKFWTDGDKQVDLDGSVFELWKVRANNGKLEYDERFGSEIRIADGEGGKIVIDGLPVNQIFALKEIKADEGFSLGAPYYFVVDGTTIIDTDIFAEYNIKHFKSGATLEYENRKIDSAWIKIAKIWEEPDTNKLTWDEIKGSLSFAIKKQSETVQTLTGADLKEVRESDGTIRYVSDVISVEPGIYRVVETKSSIDDFDVETTYVIEAGSKKTQGSTGTTEEINIQTADEVVTVVYTNTYNYTGTFPVKVSKRDLTDAREIKGARFRLSGDTLGTDVEFWSSGDVPKEFELKPGNYILTELQAPRGYKRATEEIKFTVEKNGEITITQGSATANKDGADTVVMWDERLDVEVRKIAVSGGETIGVEGAMLDLYDKDDLDIDYKLKPNKSALWTWKSHENQSEPIGEYLYAGDGRTYVLVETTAPENGYGYSKKIEFKVNENGKIYDVKYVGGSTSGTEGTTKGTEGNRILMEDKVISVKLSKVDLEENPINGQAEISVFKKSDIGQDGKPLENAKAIDTFTFNNSSEPHEFGDKLQPGTDYVFVETKVPDGYKKAANIPFRVEEDGTVTVTGAVQKDGAYLMYDAKEDTSLVIYKTVSGKLTLDQIDGDLQFHVEKISGDGGTYDQVFKIVPDFAEENGKYVLRLNNLPLGTYKVTEIYGSTTPDDMKLEVSYTIDTNPKRTDSTPNNISFAAENIVFTENEANHTVTFNNDYQYKTGTIKLTKSLTFIGTALDRDSVISEKLKFHIYKVINPGGGSDERKEEIEGSPVSGSSLTWNEEKKVYEFEMQVPVGTYIVEEKYESIDGYVMTTTHKVNGEEDTASESVYITSKQAIEEDGTLEVGYNNRYVQICSVDISKRALTLTGEKELADVTWEITGKKWDDTPITPIRWTTKKDTATGEVKPHKVTLEPGEYTLTEITAPVGYKKTNPISFTLDGNENITITSGQTDALDGSTVIMWDDPLDVEVDKVTLGGGEKVKGATLYLYDDKENKLAEHVSDENEVWQIGKYLQLGGTYRLVEKIAPIGYCYSADIEFTVGDDGDITNVTAGTTQGNKILMEDRPISIKLNKVELGSTDEELEGAVIGIYKAEDVDANGRLKDPDTEPLETWQSVKGGCHEFGTKLEAGHDYVFVETAAPKGYQVAASILFTIKEDGSVEKISTVTEEPVRTTTDGGDTVYLMEDEVYTDPNASLVLTKSIKGAGISPEDITKTNLRFHVESIGVDPAYDQVFRVGDAGFKWDGDSSKYVQYIYNLKPGKYKVTELWDDSAFSGIACTGQTWETVLNGVSGTRSSGTGVTTGEFNLENGDTIEVNYTNTYENGGTLIITKTIAGDITKEAVDGTLTFTVTENSTNKKTTYTLPGDFEYNNNTKQWTKELALTSGGYTVEESAKAPDGTTYTTSYTVNGGTSRNGAGAQVTNVIVEKGGTTTVAYTNTYTANDIDQDNSNKEDSQESGKEDSPESGKEDSQESDKEDSQESDKEDSQESDKEDSRESSKEDSQEDSQDNSKENSKENSKSDSVDNKDIYDNDSPSMVGKMVKTVEDGLIKTGDIVPVGAWLLLLMIGVAGLGVGGYALMRRREKDSLKISADELEEIKIK